MDLEHCLGKGNRSNPYRITQASDRSFLARNIMTIQPTASQSWLHLPFPGFVTNAIILCLRDRLAKSPRITPPVTSTSGDSGATR